MSITRQREGTNWKRKSRPDVPVNLPVAPSAPTGLTGSSITDTSVTLSWTPSVSSGVTEQRIYLNNVRHTTISDGTSSSTNITGLTANTPYTWKITAYNGTTGLNSVFSNTYSMATTSPAAPPMPGVPNNFVAVKGAGDPTTQIDVSWTAPTVDGSHEAATYYQVFADGVQKGGNITGTSYTIVGLTPGDVVTVTVKAFNAHGEGESTAGINVTLDSVVVAETLMGSSGSLYDHGGTEVWDGWRVYSRAKLYEFADRTGSQKPKFVAFSEQGANLGNTAPNYNTIYNHVLDELNAFYYTTPTGQTHTARWGIKLYWSNGNENFDKGALATPHTTTGINNFVLSQKALYDAVHYIDPTTGERRFPDAYAGSNPTQNAEFSGLVEDWLHPSAKYHDFVMWSMYPPGRNVTETDPTWNWPSFSESQRSNRDNGHLIRCYYRTAAARTYARNELGNPNFQLQIACGETGLADDPDDPTTRPYFAVYGMIGPMTRLSIQYDLPLPFVCWWDSLVDGQSPQIEYLLSAEPVGTNPSTRVAWQNWRSYHTTYGGVKPIAWASNPKASWKQTGTHPTS